MKKEKPESPKRLNFHWDRIPSENRVYREKLVKPTYDRIENAIAGCIVFGFIGWLLWSLVSCAVREDTPAEKAQKEAEKTRQELEGDMLYTCKLAIEFQANYKSKAEIDLEQVIIEGKTGFVAGTASFMNGFGTMIPYKFYCDFTGKNLKKAKLYKN